MNIYYSYDYFYNYSDVYSSFLYVGILVHILYFWTGFLDKLVNLNVCIIEFNDLK